MLSKSIQFGGSSVAQERLAVVNRIDAGTTNSTNLVPGAVYALDIPGTSTNTTTLQGQLCNLVPVATANADGVLVVADDAVQPAFQGEAVVTGPVTARINGTASKGDLLYPMDGQDYLVPDATNSASASAVAVALATNVATDTASIPVLFSGFLR